MGIDLCGREGGIRFNNLTWSQILKLADRYGWQPKGTEAPDWEGIHGPPLSHLPSCGLVSRSMAGPSTGNARKYGAPSLSTQTVLRQRLGGELRRP